MYYSVYTHHTVHCFLIFQRQILQYTSLNFLYWHTTILHIQSAVLSLEFNIVPSMHFKNDHQLHNNIQALLGVKYKHYIMK